MSEIIMDIDDAMRIQKLRAFWTRYGQWLTAIVVSAIVAVAGAALWQNHMNQLYTEQSDTLTALLSNKASDTENAQKLTAAAQQADAPLSAIIDLYAAQKSEQAGDVTKAQAVYKEVMENNPKAIAVKDLATIHYVRLGLLAKNDAGMLLPMLDGMVADPQKPFYGSAMELRGLLLQQQGKTEEASKVFTTLSTTDTVPATLRARAKAMISYETVHAQ